VTVSTTVDGALVTVAGALSVWRMMDQPETLRLVELGPGRGTMMRDALRAAKVLPAFRKALSVHMVEISPTLEQLQRNTLSDVDVPQFWHRSLLEVPEGGGTITLANEYIDALPVHQMVRQGWHERMIGLDAKGDFRLGLSPDPVPHRSPCRRASGTPGRLVFEWRNDLHALDIDAGCATAAPR
jgi:SAM-dependent MidA family methyltransferase